MANQGWSQKTDPATDEYVFRRQDGNETRLPLAASAPDNADYLVGTANGSLSNEIVVGTTPGGELGGTWASPTVDGTHSGSAHGVAVQDEGAAQGQALTMDFVGAGVTAAVVGSVATVTIPGGSGSGITSVIEDPIYRMQVM